jgi:GNAT superfamily N-acetyltransferase
VPGAITVRPAQRTDTAAVLECLRSAFAPHEDGYTPAAFHDTVLDAPGLERRLREMTVLVATDPGGGVVGTVSYQLVKPDEAHVRGMAVRPAWHGHGVAQILLDRVEAEARAVGCLRLSLDTTAPLTRAVRFYERNGFRASGRVADFFGMPLFEYVKPLH